MNQLSDELHKLRGTRRTRAAETPALPPGRPKYPKNLSQEAKSAFKRLCALLEKRRTLTDGDGELLRLYAITFDRHVRALAKIAEQGEVCIYTRLDSNGQPHEVEKENLWTKIAFTCEKNMTAILDRLGLTPHNRSKIKPTAKPNEKPVDPEQAAANEYFGNLDSGTWIAPGKANA